MKEPDYVVLRAAPGLPDGFLPPHWDGRWIDRSELSTSPPGWVPPSDGLHSQVNFVPAGRFEVRDYDGAVAEVWETRGADPVRPDEEADDA